MRIRNMEADILVGSVIQQKDLSPEALVRMDEIAATLRPDEEIVLTSERRTLDDDRINSEDHDVREFGPTLRVLDSLGYSARAEVPRDCRMAAAFMEWDQEKERWLRSAGWVDP